MPAPAAATDPRIAPATDLKSAPAIDLKGAPDARLEAVEFHDPPAPERDDGAPGDGQAPSKQTHVSNADALTSIPLPPPSPSHSHSPESASRKRAREQLTDSALLESEHDIKKGRMGGEERSLAEAERAARQVREKQVVGPALDAVDPHASLRKDQIKNQDKSDDQGKEEKTQNEGSVVSPQAGEKPKTATSFLSFASTASPFAQKKSGFSIFNTKADTDDHADDSKSASDSVDLSTHAKGALSSSAFAQILASTSSATDNPDAASLHLQSDQAAADGASAQTFTEQEHKTGEEDEELRFSLRAKLYRMQNDAVVVPEGAPAGKQIVGTGASAGTWKEKGVGQVRVLRHRSTGQTRIVMRTDGVHRVVLNAALFPGMKFEIPKGQEHFLRFVLPQDGAFVQYTFKSSSAKAIEELQSELQSAILNGSREDEIEPLGPEEKV